MICLVRYAEIALKGKNRSEFEKKLVQNIKASLKFTGVRAKIKRIPGRLLLEAEQEPNLRKVFGIVSYSPCIRVEVKIEVLCAEALKLAEKQEKTNTFRITAKRLTKELSFSSQELNKQIGAFIVEKKGWKVALDKPELDIGIEIIGDEAFLFTKTISCFGGLPVGVEGKVLALVSDEKSFLATLLMMRRGCAVEIVSLSNVNYSLLQAFYPHKLVLHKIKKIPELDDLAKKLKCIALIVPDTLSDFKEHPMNISVLRPLIAFSEEEIRNEIEKYKNIL